MLEKLQKIANTHDQTTVEHPDFHPEGHTINHIRLVALRAAVWAPHLLAAAWLHDICKPDAGHWNETYWTNRNHAEMAAELCDQPDTVKFIESLGCDVALTRFVVRRHMNFKFGWPGRKTQVTEWERNNLNHLKTFESLDNMLNQDFPPAEVQIEHPKFGKRKGTCTFVGMSEVDKIARETFTVTIDRTPFRFGFNEFNFKINNRALLDK